MWLIDLLQNRAHNRKLYRDGLANKDEVRLTTIGWRPDPINQRDGMTDGFYDNTPSMNVEFYKVIRSNKKKVK